MDPLSIVVNANSAIKLITTTSQSITAFIRLVRDSRTDLNELDQELQSIRRVLEPLNVDIKRQSGNGGDAQPSVELDQQILGILKCCMAAISQIDQTLGKYSELVDQSIRGQFKWAITGRNEVQRLRALLEPNRRALEIAVNVSTLTTTRAIRQDTNVIIQNSNDLKQNTDEILDEIKRLQDSLSSLSVKSKEERGYILQRYLENLTSYTESVQPDFDGGTESTTDTNRRSSRESEAVPETLDTDASVGFSQAHQKPEAPDIDPTTATLSKMGFVDEAAWLPRSFVSAISNRLTREQLQGQRADRSTFFKHSAPLFFVGAFIFPATIRTAIDELNVHEIAKTMTPAVLRGYKRHAVRGAPWPALLPSADPTEETMGMLLVGVSESQRRRVHAFQNGMLDLSRATVELELRDGSKMFHEAVIYVWNGPSDQLVPPQLKAFSPSDMFQSEWLSHIFRHVEEEEEEDWESDDALSQ